MSEDVLRGALANVLCNTSNYPEPAITRLLGRDMQPLIDKVVDAVTPIIHAERMAAKHEQREFDASLAATFVLHGDAEMRHLNLPLPQAIARMVAEDAAGIIRESVIV